MGKASGRKCVLKKWMVKINPTASKRFITVNDLAYIDEPSREELGEKYRKPEYQSAESDYGHPPENCQVVKFLPVGPSAIVWPGTFSNEPFYGGNKILNILFVEPECVFAKYEFGHGKPFPPFLPDQVKNVEGEIAKGDHRTNAMQHTGSLHTSKDTWTGTLAQSIWANFSIMPVTARRMKLIITKICVIRWFLLKRL